MILPIELFIHTLRVAKQLEWTGHEISECMDDIEKIDEDKRISIMGNLCRKTSSKTLA